MRISLGLHKRIPECVRLVHTVKVVMAEEVSPQMTDRTAAERLKLRHCVTTSLAHGQEESVVDSDTLEYSESCDSGILYLNPQTPNWTLAEKCADVLSEEDAVRVEREHGSRQFQCEKHIMDNRTLGCNKRKLAEKAKTSAIQMTSKLKELHVKEIETSKDALKLSVKKLLKNADKDKIPRLLEAMKKRSEVDTTHRPFKCPDCHWAFKKLCYLQSHLQTHSGLKPHVCDICGKAYSHQGTLQQHKRLHTGERPYHCPFCDKTYIWSSDYRKHIRTHTGEKPYVCKECGKDFIRSSDLRKHERNMHTNNKPFPCPHCGKTFNKPLSLKRHERKHLGARPYSCPDCGKTFALASRMAEHQKIHRGVRPFVCAVCSKCFTKSSNLTEHEAIHSGVRPHKCTECGLAFAMASRLVRHQYIHNKEKPYSCTGCSKNFSRLANLEQHQQQNCVGQIDLCLCGV